MLDIFYRVNPKISKTPIVYPNDKFKLSEFALKSFVNSLGNLKANITVIYDTCPCEYHELFKKYLPDHKAEFLNNAGNRGSWQYQLDLAKQSQADLIYFAEDDYYYRKNALQDTYNFMLDTKIDFATPYNHPDNYTLSFHNEPFEVRMYGGYLYRTTGTTTNTFMVNKNILLKVMPVFETFTKGNSDAGYWMSLTGHKLISMWSYWSWRHAYWPQMFSKKYKLWCPVTSMATHLESTGIALNMRKEVLK